MINKIILWCVFLFVVGCGQSNPPKYVDGYGKIWYLSTRGEEGVTLYYLVDGFFTSNAVKKTVTNDEFNKHYKLVSE